jgi:DNA-binding NarL/FixJ family response regulator
LDEAQGPVDRSKLLPGYVEIVLASGDTAAARAAVEELDAIARDLDAPVLRASAAQAEGMVLLAEGDAGTSVAALRRAWTTWQELDAPYEAAQVRLLLARGLRQLGDEDTAEMELDAAAHIFRTLGATPDLTRLEGLRGPAPATDGGLTQRELEVLRLVATGMTNREIAEELVLSEKTVARHVSNIFAKVGLSTRAAATAYAYEHDLV